MSVSKGSKLFCYDDTRKCIFCITVIDISQDKFIYLHQGEYYSAEITDIEKKYFFNTQDLLKKFNNKASTGSSNLQKKPAFSTTSDVYINSNQSYLEHQKANEERRKQVEKELEYERKMNEAGYRYDWNLKMWTSSVFTWHG